jgi:hypothetical protein
MSQAEFDSAYASAGKLAGGTNDDKLEVRDYFHYPHPCLAARRTPGLID